MGPPEEPTAISDLQNIFDFIEDQKMEVPDARYKEAVEAIGRLRHVPTRLRLINSPAQREVRYRCFPTGCSRHPGTGLPFKIQKIILYISCENRPELDPGESVVDLIKNEIHEMKLIHVSGEYV